MEGFDYREDIKKYSTGEVAEILGVHQQTVRKWCSDYKEFIVVPRDESNQRFFTEDLLKILTFIKELKDRGENIHVIKKVLANSKGVEEIKEQSVEMATLDKLTGADLKELMLNQFSEMLIAREKELKAEFEERLEQVKEEIITRQQEQLQAENKKLMEYVAITKEEENKKSFWSKIFGK